MKLWAVLKAAYVRSMCIVSSLLQALPYEDRITHSQSWLFEPPHPTPPSLRLTLEAPLQLMLSIHNKASIFKISTQMGRFSKIEHVLPAKCAFQISVCRQSVHEYKSMHTVFNFHHLNIFICTVCSRQTRHQLTVFVRAKCQTAY